MSLTRLRICKQGAIRDGVSRSECGVMSLMRRS